MNYPWFKRRGWFYLPLTIPGSVLSLLTLAFWIQVFVAMDRHSHSVSDTLCGAFPFVAGGFLLLDWIAGRTSE